MNEERQQNQDWPITDAMLKQIDDRLKEIAGNMDGDWSEKHQEKAKRILKQLEKTKMNEEQRRQKFYNDASKIVKETIDEVEVATGDGTLEDALLPFRSEHYDRDELARYHRKIWLQWARGEDDASQGWLMPYDAQEERHREIQRRQAEEMFAIGYQAALHDRDKPNVIAHEPVTRRATIQAFTYSEARILLAALTKFLEHTMKKHGVVLSKEVADRLLRKLEILADVNLSHVDYFVPVDCTATTKVKPKWSKKTQKPSKPVVGKHRGLKSFMKK